MPTVVRGKQVITSQPPANDNIMSRVYRGMSTANGQQKSFVLYDIDLIKQDLINHFHIRQGELLENPKMGTIIWDLIHDPLTDELSDAVTKNVSDIINNDPRIRANRIIVSKYRSGIQVECDLEYLPYNFSESLQLRFDNSE